MKTLLTICGLIIATAIIAQDALNQAATRQFERSITPNAVRNSQLVAIWDAIDLAKTNTTLLRLVITRSGTNTTIAAVESVQVKLIEN